MGKLYRVKIASDQVYIVDTTYNVYWPENSPTTRAPLWPRMNPESEVFSGKVIGEVISSERPRKK